MASATRNLLRASYGMIEASSALGNRSGIFSAVKDRSLWSLSACCLGGSSGNTLMDGFTDLDLRCFIPQERF